LLGFLGITADITGFKLDPPVLIFTLLFSAMIQLVKDNADAELAQKKEQSKSSKK
jgi:hypothetical protein